MNNDEKILAMLVELKESVDRRFDAIDRRFEAVDRHFAHIEERLDSLDTRSTHIEERLDELDTRSLRTAVLLETEVARDIRLVYEGQQLLQEKLDSLAPVERVEALEDDVDVLKDVVHQACADIAELKKAQ